MGLIMSNWPVSNREPKPSAVMLVEDDPTARRAVTALLKSQGHTVHAYGNAEEAAASLRFFHPDVAVLDVRLPGMFGNDLACIVKSRSPKTQIIFLTAEQEISCKIADFVVLPKPLDPPRLLYHICH